MNGCMSLFSPSFLDVGTRPKCQRHLLEYLSGIILIFFLKAEEYLPDKMNSLILESLNVSCYNTIASYGTSKHHKDIGNQVL